VIHILIRPKTKERIEGEEKPGPLNSPVFLKGNQ